MSHILKMNMYDHLCDSRAHVRTSTQCFNTMTLYSKYQLSYLNRISELLLSANWSKVHSTTCVHVIWQCMHGMRRVHGRIILLAGTERTQYTQNCERCDGNSLYTWLKCTGEVARITLSQSERERQYSLLLITTYDRVSTHYNYSTCIRYR